MAWQIRWRDRESGVEPEVVDGVVRLRLMEKEGALCFTLPAPSEGETRGWLGAAAHRTYLLERLATISPLFPKPAGVAWVRMAELTPWVPVAGVAEVSGDSLQAIAETGHMTMSLLWHVILPVAQSLSRAAAEGVACARVEPGHLLLAGGKLAVWNSPLVWEQAVGDTARDPVRVAAHFLHWLLCAVRKNQRELEPPGALWAVCARGLEGEYGANGLTRFRTELGRLAPQSATGLRRAWIMDAENLWGCTRCLPDPWRTLRALEHAGSRPDLVVVVHQEGVPETMQALWAEAGWQSLSGESVWNRVTQAAAAYPEVSVMTGDRSPEVIRMLVGPGTKVVALQSEPEQPDPFVAELRAALMLVRGRK